MSQVKLYSLVLLALFISGLNVSNQIPNDEPPGLESILEEGLLFQDRNGDGHIDFVNGHIVLGQNPSDVDVAAAANVAARLGFETTSLNLPITTGTAGVSVAVGQSALHELAIDATGLGVDLEPGVGVVALLAASPGTTLAIAGGDDVGTTAAALVFAARAPHIWDPEGST